MENNENITPGSDGKITVLNAVEMTTNWRTYLTNSQQGFQTKAFLIPITSIKSLMDSNPYADGIRAYIGLEDESDANTGKLIFVPVVNGEDIMFVEGGTNNLENIDDSNMYDRTQPCPPTCSPSNELNP